MLLSPSKCPICGKMSVYASSCNNCWWESPDMLEARARSYRAFAEAWDPEKKQFKPGRVIHLTNESTDK